MRQVTEQYNKTAQTRPPAKLNLFLELLARRPDGFHEIDTVMIPIDWCDELLLQRIPEDKIELQVQWRPSLQIVSQRLGLDIENPGQRQLLDIPCDESNLVHRALISFREAFDIRDGFHCQLGKQIPAGAGMGGASSDAASALLCAARLCDVPSDHPQLFELAAQIGSDVPFFLGMGGTTPIDGARATGRGEHITAIELAKKLDFVVVFPAVSLSTAEVYANSQVPAQPRDGTALVELLQTHQTTDLGPAMLNRLTEPAKKLAPQIAEILESLWHDELRTCQLTGSGSACFAISASSGQAKQAALKLRVRLEPGAFVMATQSTQVPARIDVS